MRAIRAIYRLLPTVLLSASVASCALEDGSLASDNNVKYNYLYNCTWICVSSSAVFEDSLMTNILCFENGKVLFYEAPASRFNTHRYIGSEGFTLDDVNNILLIGNNKYLIHNLSSTSMTLFLNSDESSILTYRREEF